MDATPRTLLHERRILPTAATKPSPTRKATPDDLKAALARLEAA